MSRPRSVVIIGAGVAGLCCAYYLRKQDVDVVILESNRVGSGASWGNGGWLCPVQAGPLPEPGLTVFGLRALFDRDSALYFKSSEWAELTPWLLRFWTYCNESDYRHGFAALARLGRRVFELVDEMVDDGVKFELHRKGMLLAARKAADARAELRKLSPMRELGYELPDDLVLGSDLHTLEPALAPEVDAGFVIPGWHVHPESFTSGLAAAVRKANVEIAEGVEVTDFELHGSRVTSARTPTGKYGADAFIIAAGAWTRPLAKMLGLRFPMQGGKGYSFFVTPSVLPQRPILLADVHVGCTPLGERMRIGGTLEFSGLNTRLDQRRIGTIIKGAQSSFLPWDTGSIDSEWAGMRPLTPDGLPVLDRAPRHDNLYFATGYGMQGVTLAAPAGAALTEFITSGSRPDVLEPFRLDRLYGLRLLGGNHRNGRI
jgi:D-amino-acid dehydrogenase